MRIICLLFAALTTVPGAASCDRAEDKAMPENTTDTVTPSTSGPPLDTIGSGSVNWTLRGIQAVLTDLGLEPADAGEARHPFMSASGKRFMIDGGEIQAYVYADAGAVGRDTDDLDRATLSPPGATVDWPVPPTLIVSNNLALILLTRDTTLRTRIQRAVKPDLTRHDPSPE